ncbi:MAG: sugar phosphate isomerase/epimerase [Candidatus Bathyarchaeia archaeon]
MAKIEVGLSMLHCLSSPFRKMTQNVKNAKTANIELVDDGFHELTKQRIKTLKEIGQSYNKKYSVHAPFADINIASPSKQLLKAMLKRLETSIAHANALEARVWVFHPGIKTGISMFYPRMDWQRNLQTANTLAKLAEDCGLKIAIENVPEPYPFLLKSVQDFKSFFAEADKNIGLVLDVGHSNINRQTQLFLETFEKKIVHVHVHDNSGNEDQHLGVGRGSVNWERLAASVKRLSQDVVVVVESVEHVDESLARVREMLT